jgi:hypothetical protein
MAAVPPPAAAAGAAAKNRFAERKTRIPPDVVGISDVVNVGNP